MERMQGKRGEKAEIKKKGEVGSRAMTEVLKNKLCFADREKAGLSVLGY